KITTCNVALFHQRCRCTKAAGPGVRMKKTREGYSFEGSPEQIERMKKRLR
ncbi:hypothetical protein G0A00_25215, partial [Yangia sp. PrR002]|nr:hypothetical protein [Salipiger sp. PrR002]NDW58765.1 hypothetical protein [Salipiger sp. PrR004]